MYFKKLELIGFKSFFDKTTLHFEPGITAVVGPNGCGKSNIVDSMRWVLGEQSAKSLRGSEMQDVIFNGSDSKEALGMAEVTLTFDNGKRFFDFDHPEVAITRRIFRSGESEYLINKIPVRLKDIMDLLLGTGIGAESYSIVAQGKIDLVLSSRPEDRRLVFDEASGITKYKSQKRETTRRLEETEQNLLRVNDIITEVRRQIGSLERQANKARKYKEVFEELKQKEINSSLLEKKQLLKQKNEILNQLKELESQSAQLQDLIKDEESKIANRRTELKAQEDSMMNLRNQILNLENQVVRNHERINFNKEKLIELTETKIYLQAQIEQAQNKLILDEEKLSHIKTEFAGLGKNIELKTQDLKEKEAQITNLAGSIKNSLEIITRSKKGILELVGKIAGTNNEISDSSARHQVFMARGKRLEIEKAKAHEERSITQEQLNNITQEVEGIKKIVGELNFKMSGIKEDLEKEGLSLVNVNSEIEKLEKEKLTLVSHKEFLEKIKTKYEDIGESMNALIFLDNLPSENISGLVIKIKNQLDLSDKEKESLGAHRFKLSGEAKPVELDTQRIDEKINRLEQGLAVLQNEKNVNQARTEELNKAVFSLQQSLRSNEMSLANKESSHSTILEQFNKIKEEEEIILMELLDVEKEISRLGDTLDALGSRLTQQNNEQAMAEGLILKEENNIFLNSKSREDLLVNITQTKTELAGLNKSLVSGESTLKILEDTYRQDKESLDNFAKQINNAEIKKEALELEIKEAQL
ncbi:MAG: AAA family ATPase, partial [Candidatus Omnitrophica bacterium]|nr:AAA family ATPase [Candidatus Omnitrophota bacterium]